MRVSSGWFSVNNIIMNSFIYRFGQLHVRCQGFRFHCLIHGHLLAINQLSTFAWMLVSTLITSGSAFPAGVNVIRNGCLSPCVSLVIDGWLVQGIPWLLAPAPTATLHRISCIDNGWVHPEYFGLVSAFFDKEFPSPPVRWLRLHDLRCELVPAWSNPSQWRCLLQSLSLPA